MTIQAQNESTVAPIPVKANTSGHLLTAGDAGTADLAPSSSNAHQITGSSTQYTLPTAGGRYLLIAAGNSCWVNEGANPTMTVNGSGLYCPEGAVIGPIRLTGAKLGVIGASAAGYLYVVELT